MLVEKKYGKVPFREIPAILRRHPQLNIGVAGTGAGGTVAARERKKQQDSKKRMAGRAIVGAGAAQGAYQLAGVGAKQYNDRKVKPREEAASDLSRNKRKKIWDAHRQKHGLRGTGMIHGAAEKWQAAFRDYPLELPGAKIERKLAFTHGGKTGIRVGAGVTAAGAVAGALSRRGRKEPVGKSELQVRERRASIARAAGLTAGLAGLSYGTPRMLGRTLTRGASVAGAMGSKGTQKTLLRGESLRLAAIRRTAGMGGIQRAPYIGPMAAAVPKGARPLVATYGGVELTRQSTPVTRDSYRSATPSDVYGW